MWLFNMLIVEIPYTICFSEWSWHSGGIIQNSNAAQRSHSSLLLECLHTRLFEWHTVLSSVLFVSSICFCKQCLTKGGKGIT
jgi:hypothetical protein